VAETNKTTIDRVPQRGASSAARLQRFAANPATTSRLVWQRDGVIIAQIVALPSVMYRQRWTDRLSSCSSRIAPTGADDRLYIGENCNDACTALHFAIERLDRVIAVQLGAMLGGSLASSLSLGRW
jgi:hypothetical protein